jgi:serine/threonine protein kinase
MSKVKIIDKSNIKNIKNERNLLSKLNHPFIVNMHFSFQNNNFLYLVIDLLTGGDLRYHFYYKKFFSEVQTKFFLSCVILGLEYCHSNLIIHHDIKPENIILDEHGYAHIADFGIAKMQQPNNAKETSGTLGYMAPEVLFEKEHTTISDYFSLGVICYEFMNGEKPYLAKTRKEMKVKIKEKEIKLDKTNIKEGWSLEAADFINQLLKRQPQKRLGYTGGITELKKHAWLKDINWKDLYNGLLKAPYIPFGEENFEHSFCNAEEVKKEDTEKRYQEIMKSIEYKNMFDDYYYFNRYDAKTQGLKMLYFNIHEKIYKVKRMPRLNTGRITVNKKYQNMKIPIKPGLKRGMSPMGAMPNKAFTEANKFIIKRKNRSKQKLDIPKLKLHD